jgi:hypothetical protein
VVDRAVLWFEDETAKFLHSFNVFGKAGTPEAAAPQGEAGKDPQR